MLIGFPTCNLALTAQLALKTTLSMRPRLPLLYVVRKSVAIKKKNLFIVEFVTIRK